MLVLAGMDGNTSQEGLWAARSAERDASSFLSVFVRPLWQADSTWLHMLVMFSPGPGTSTAKTATLWSYPGLSSDALVAVGVLERGGPSGDGPRASAPTFPNFLQAVSATLPFLSLPASALDRSSFSQLSPPTLVVSGPFGDADGGTDSDHR